MQTDQLDDLLGDSRVLWTEDVLRFGDTDLIGHVNNSVFSVLCESGRVHLFRTKLDPTLERGQYFVIARLAIDFRAELHYPGRVRTGTWLTKIGRSSLTLRQAILDESRIAGEAEGICVLVDGATRRPTPFPDAARAAAEAMIRSPAS
jgi:acyl-CoA thioester hydrolase